MGSGIMLFQEAGRMLEQRKPKKEENYPKICYLDIQKHLRKTPDQNLTFIPPSLFCVFLKRFIVQQDFYLLPEKISLFPPLVLQ